MVCHYWFFNHGYRIQDSVCNDCHDLAMLCLKVSDTVIITIKRGCIIHDISKSDTIHFLENSQLDDRRYI